MGKGTDDMAGNEVTINERIDSSFEDDKNAFSEETGGHLREGEADTQESHNFMALYEESLKSIQEGKIVKGEILHVDKEYVLVDIGYKSEGIIPAHEFFDAEGHLTAAVGDQVEVLLVRKEDKDGQIILSKKKAAGIKLWNDVEKAYKEQGTVRGKIISRVKGGFSVDIGISAFLPGSQADLPQAKDLDHLIGTEHDFRVISYERRHENIVLSRRALLEVERMAQREKTLEILEEGAVMKGTVSNMTDYGLFIDLGGIDGLVHITDLSWSRVRHPSEMFQVGDEITVKVLRLDRERNRVSLGIKQLSPDPWTKVQDRYPVGTRVTGRIVGLKKYGAFVELEAGVEGLIHVSEMSWTRKIQHPSEILSVGTMVETVVLGLDVTKKRISLGIKQLEPNPWDSIAEKYPIGTVIEGKIKNITDFGIFVGIDQGIDGLVHVSDISWTKHINKPSEHYKEGDALQAVILDIDRENERLSLGVKQLKSDPWSEIPEKYKPGTKVSGTVTHITDFGIFVELEEGVEGLIHISQLPKGKQGIKGFQVHDEIQAEVVNVSQEERRIGLSIRKLLEASEGNIQRRYLNNQKKATSNLGELLKEKMMGAGSEARIKDQESEIKAAVEPEPDDGSEAVENDSGKGQSEVIGSH